MNQYLPDDEGLFPVPRGERMPATPRLFSIDDEQLSRRPLLRNVRRARRALQRLEAPSS